MTAPSLPFDRVLFVDRDRPPVVVRQPGIAHRATIVVCPISIALILADMLTRSDADYGPIRIFFVCILPLLVATLVDSCHRLILWREIVTLAQAMGLSRGRA